MALFIPLFRTVCTLYVAFKELLITEKRLHEEEVMREQGRFVPSAKLGRLPPLARAGGGMGGGYLVTNKRNKLFTFLHVNVRGNDGYCTAGGTKAGCNGIVGYWLPNLLWCVNVMSHRMR
jgi:hypothetical protein